jgi:hypothetical protein
VCAARSIEGPTADTAWRVRRRVSIHPPSRRSDKASTPSDQIATTIDEAAEPSAAGRQIAAGDGPGGIGQALEGQQDAAEQPPGRQDTEDQSDHGAEQQHPTDRLVEHGLRLLGRRAGLHGEVHDLVGAELLDGHDHHAGDHQCQDHEQADEAEAQREHRSTTSAVRPDR